VAPIASVIPRNEDRWLDDLQSRSPKDVERGTADLEQRGTAALPVIPPDAAGCQCRFRRSERRR
jgi:hypothetical protein